LAVVGGALAVVGTGPLNLKSPFAGVGVGALFPSSSSFVSFALPSLSFALAGVGIGVGGANE
jgi:hypothetical protein